MHIKLKLLVAAISIAVIPNTALAQGGPPPGDGGGGGGGAATTLSSLGCGPAEIARVNGAEEWDCSADLTANEAAAAAAQSTADTAVSNAATAQSTANTAVSNAATAQSTANTAVSNAATAQSTANTAVSNAATAQSTANTAASNAADAQSRVGVLEGQNLDGRLSTVEGIAGLFERIIIVRPIGLTASDNGFELLDAVTEAAAMTPAPSASDPILIFVEPGVYDIDPGTVSLPSHVSLRGAGEGLTRIVGASSGSTVNVVIARDSALISDLSVQFIGPFGNGIEVAGQDVIIRHVAISGPSSNAVNNGISAGVGTNAKVENLSITGFNVGVSIRGADITVANLNALGNTNGVFVQDGGKVEVWDSILQVLNTGSGLGLLASSTGTEATIWNSQIGNLSSQIFAFTRVYGSRMRVVRTAQTGGSGFVEVASSQISVVNFSSASQATCVFSYDLALLPLDGVCQ